MTGRLAGRVAIITGVNGGIGRAFAREGALIVGSGFEEASTDSVVE